MVSPTTPVPLMGYELSLQETDFRQNSWCRMNSWYISRVLGAADMYLDTSFVWFAHGIADDSCASFGVRAISWRNNFQTELLMQNEFLIYLETSESRRHACGYILRLIRTWYHQRLLCLFWGMSYLFKKHISDRPLDAEWVPDTSRDFWVPQTRIWIYTSSDSDMVSPTTPVPLMGYELSL